MKSAIILSVCCYNWTE